MTLTTRTPILLLAALSLTACSSSTGDSAPSPTGGIDQTEAFCALVIEGQGYTSDAEVATLTESMYLAIAAATTDDDPAALAAIRAWGSAMEVAIDEFVPVYEELLTLTDDPALRRGIELTLELNRDFGTATADSLVNVTSLTEYSTILDSITADTIAALEDPDDQDALLYFDQYIMDNCNIAAEY